MGTTLTPEFWERFAVLLVAAVAVTFVLTAVFDTLPAAADGPSRQPAVGILGADSAPADARVPSPHPHIRQLLTAVRPSSRRESAPRSTRSAPRRFVAGHRPAPRWPATDRSVTVSLSRPRFPPPPCRGGTAGTRRSSDRRMRQA